MYDSVQAMIDDEKTRHLPFWKLIIQDDCREKGISESEDFEEMRAMYQAMCASDEHYDPHLLSGSRLSGTNAAKLDTYRKKGETLSGDFISDVMVRALKIAESNACMKRIVAAPTAGSCGVVPAVLISMQKRYGFPEDDMVKALIVAGGIGGVIASRAFLAGAEGGCQAEIGSASSMAAGAAVSLLHNSGPAIANASALAMKNLLGLACDPVAGLVEVPCVKRNAMGAVNAITAVDLTLAGIRSAIPCDEVFDAMKSIGRQMNENIRETGTGGLAATPTGQKIRTKTVMK